MRLAYCYAQACHDWQRHRKALLHPPATPVFSLREISRIRHYHYGTTYLRALFSTYLGRRARFSERMAFLRLAALAAFFDDLTDAVSGKKADTPATPEAYGAAHDLRGIAPLWLQQVRAQVPPAGRPLFEHCLAQVFTTETSAPAEGDVIALSLCDLQKKSERKGGCSVLLFRCLLDVPVCPTEEALWMQFGTLIQGSDDLFDLWHDRATGICTPITHQAERQQLETMNPWFEAQAQRVLQQAGRACSEVYFLIALTRVAWHHYAGLVTHQGALPLHDRQLMVVDMDRWIHRWQLVKELLRPPVASTISTPGE